jgi:hypothetical protein
VTLHVLNSFSSSPVLIALMVVVEGHFGEELLQEEIWLQETNQSTQQGIWGLET